jgi:hypothetical protein
LTPIKPVLNGCFGRFEALFRFVEENGGVPQVREREVGAILGETILLR